LNKTKELNAFITPLPESALHSAEAAQQRILKGVSEIFFVVTMY